MLSSIKECNNTYSLFYCLTNHVAFIIELQENKRYKFLGTLYETNGNFQNLVFITSLLGI